MRARAVIFDEVGGPEVLRLAEVALKDPGSNEVLVRIEAIGLNRADVMFRCGDAWYQPTFPASRLGVEGAGEVVAIGSEVAGFGVGDPVSILITEPAASSTGVYGNYAVVPARALLHRPLDMDPVTGAAMWWSYLTAYGALVEIGKIGPGDQVVITAASSSVGIAAIQIAASLGATPIAVTRGEAKKQQLYSAGAEHVVVAEGGGIVEQVMALTNDRGVRIVFDSVGGPGLSAIARLVAREGILIVYGWLDPRPATLPRQWPLSIFGFALNVVTDDLGALQRGQAFIHAGLRSEALVPLVDRAFDLADVAEAHRYMESNNQVGKIVVKVQ